MANGLGDVAQGSPWAIFAAMGAAMLFGVVHALMPGHGKTVLFSYHLGQKGSLLSSIATGTILALTHVGIAIVLVLAGFAVISKAFAFGGRTPQFETASGVLIVLIGAFLLWRSGAHAHRGDTSPGNGRALAFVTGLVPCPLTTFILAYALARGLLAAGLVVTAAMAAGMIVTIATVAVIATLSRERLIAFFARTEGLRERLGRVLEIGGASLVVLFGFWLIFQAQAF
jgi:ABC-type nickel/cobalt efflux system permease component RcnA